MSLTASTVWYDNGWYCNCPWCGSYKMVSDEEKERFDNGESVYLECTDEECGNSFYLEKEDKI